MTAFLWIVDFMTKPWKDSICVEVLTCPCTSFGSTWRRRQQGLFRYATERKMEWSILFDVCEMVWRSYSISLLFHRRKKSVHFTSYLMKVRKKILDILLCIGEGLNVNVQILNRFWNYHFLINIRCLLCFLCDPYVMLKVKRLNI